tara:strand:- start:2630 stop:2935 length:306 start_codon:yes stop_codon:yes gene_type:complete
MENFTLSQLNEIVGLNAGNEIVFTSRQFKQINASNEASYFIEALDQDLIGLVYVTDRGEDASTRYRMSTDSLMSVESYDNVASDAQAQPRADEAGVNTAAI